MSLWIGFSMPAALCIYWIANNLLSMIQELVSQQLLKKDYARAAAMQAERELREKEEEKERKRLAAEERARRLEEEKLHKGKKKKGEKKPAQEDGKISAAVKEASRVGMRQYARGRAYDPYRYSPDGPTAYPGEAPLFVQQDSAGVPEESEGLEVPMETALQPVLEESEVPEDVLEDDGAVLEDALEDGGAEAEAPYAEEAEESDESDETK